MAIPGKSFGMIFPGLVSAAWFGVLPPSVGVHDIQQPVAIDIARAQAVTGSIASFGDVVHDPRSGGIRRIGLRIANKPIAGINQRGFPGSGWRGKPMESRPTGRTVELILNAAFGNPMMTARYEGLCAGDPNTEVSGAVVCYAPTVDFLQRVADEQRNLPICREHPFFLHGGVNYSYTSEGLEAATKDDPVVTAKRNFIASHKLMVYRYGAAWDQFRPHAQSAALAKALGLEPIDWPAGNRSRAVVCNLASKTT